jgi:hypothetical protein
VIEGPVSARMQATLAAAVKRQVETKHDFGIPEPGIKNSPSPRRSRAGLYFFDCRRCLRAIFEDGTGSAASTGCA